MKKATKRLLEALERRGPYEKLEDVRAALEAGADPNALSSRGVPAIVLAATPAHAADGVVAALLAAGARVDDTDKDGRTALHHAAFGDRPIELESVRLLLAAGASVNTADLGGDSPLHATAFNDCVEMAEFLLDSGAKLDVTNHAGETPAEAAKQARAKGVLTVLRRRPTRKY